MKLWGGRFTKPTSELVDQYNASITYDWRLAQDDIAGSIAHARMLGHCQIISAEDAAALVAGLENIGEQIQQQTIEFRLQDEDIHMNIERLLHQAIGPVAGKLHTARSRNDQVALTTRLYLRRQVGQWIGWLSDLQQALVVQAIDHIDVIMPGYTHLQRAQPVLFSHHMLAYVFMLQRDIERLRDSFARINCLPLGAGAIAGTTFPIDRAYVAELLQFDAVCPNSIDAVSDRDFIIEFFSHAALIMMHLSRLSEELILWSSQEFAFIELDDAFTTGSSMMPQKKNPDVAELARGKTGRVYGALQTMLTVMKGLPLTYNKDMQEDKESLFDVVDTVSMTLQIYTPMMNSMTVQSERMLQAAQQGFSNATDLADYLTAKGLPFREAHALVGQLVLTCIQRQCVLQDLPLIELQQHSPLFAEDVAEVLHLQSGIQRRAVTGGTAQRSVEQQIQLANQLLSESRQWLQEHFSTNEK